MPDIAILPTARARTAAADLNPRNRDTCGVYDVAGRLGQAHRDLPWLRRYLDRLIEHDDFPAPFPLIRSGVQAASRWPVVAVDAWFDGQLPPAARALVGQAERYAIDARLAAGAATLFPGDVA